MTPQEAYKRGGYLFPSGYRVKDWFAMGSVFLPQPLEHNGQIIVGARNLATMDFASRCMLHHTLLASQPSAVFADVVINHFEELFRKEGKPRRGIVVSHSVWVASSAYHTDPDLQPRSGFLKEHSIEFPEMDEAEKLKILLWSQDQALRCEFDGNKIGK